MSQWTVSDTSKSRQGSGFDLLFANVLKRPGSKEVRQTWNSIVFGFAITTALLPSSSRRMYLKASSCEHNAKVNASVKPAIANSKRIKSVSREMGCWEPVQRTGAGHRGILLNE